MKMNLFQAYNFFILYHKSGYTNRILTLSDKVKLTLNKKLCYSEMMIGKENLISGVYR